MTTESHDPRLDTGEDDLASFVEEASERDEAFTSHLADARLRMSVLRSLVDARQAERLTQSTIAERMGTTQSAVSELEGGASDPRLSTLQRYARAVGAHLSISVVDSSALITAELGAASSHEPAWTNSEVMPHAAIYAGSYTHISSLPLRSNDIENLVVTVTTAPTEFLRIHRGGKIHPLEWHRNLTPGDGDDEKVAV
jgi:transcriptional regulator with XRE-family HTH domain